jgi:hypothetical protein
MVSSRSLMVVLAAVTMGRLLVKVGCFISGSAVIQGRAHRKKRKGEAASHVHGEWGCQEYRQALTAHRVEAPELHLHLDPCWSVLDVRSGPRPVSLCMMGLSTLAHPLTDAYCTWCIQGELDVLLKRKDGEPGGGEGAGTAQRVAERGER